LLGGRGAVVCEVFHRRFPFCVVFNLTAKHRLLV
jgi:hypothetical protein